MVCKFLVVIVLLSVQNRVYGCEPTGTPACKSASDCTGVGIGSRVVYCSNGCCVVEEQPNVSSGVANEQFEADPAASDSTVTIQSFMVTLASVLYAYFMLA